MDFQEKIHQTGQQLEMKKGEICEFVEIFEAETARKVKNATQAYCLR
jgi:hypothetical protein